MSLKNKVWQKQEDWVKWSDVLAAKKELKERLGRADSLEELNKIVDEVFG